MNAIVYNTDGTVMHWAWESMAIRAGLMLCERTFDVGGTPYCIFYRKMMAGTPVQKRFELLLSNTDLEEDKQALLEMREVIKTLSSRKRRTKPEIIFLKQTEKLLNRFFEELVDKKIDTMKKFGLPALTPIAEDNEKALTVWLCAKEQGEHIAERRLSDLLSFKLAENSAPGSDLFIIYGPPTLGLEEKVQLTQLATVPNINLLNTQDLIGLRKRLRPVRDRLNTFLPRPEFDPQQTDYCVGPWDMEGLMAFAPTLQHELDQQPELQWAKKLDPTSDARLMIGMMDAAQLWQMMKAHDLLPDDTWKVLDDAIRSGVRCQQVPIMAIVAPPSELLLANLTEEESLGHRRKTIAID